LPNDVLFPLAAPPLETKAFAAYEEIRQELLDSGVQVTLANDEQRILAFADPTPLR
jgi:gentisate 1,2-dioxygenase